jgi:hypothetical protein
MNIILWSSNWELLQITKLPTELLKFYNEQEVKFLRNTDNTENHSVYIKKAYTCRYRKNLRFPVMLKERTQLQTERNTFYNVQQEKILRNTDVTEINLYYIKNEYTVTNSKIDDSP